MTRRKNINWSELVIKQEASGKTVPDFCVDEGIHPNTFYINRKKVRIKNFVEIIPPQIERSTSRVLVEYEKLKISIGPDSENALRSLFSVLGITK